MTDEEALKQLNAGWDLLMNYARVIALLPIENWIEMLDKAETVGPFVDPTLYRDYLYSGKGEIIKKIMRSALDLKRTMEEIQPQVRELLQRERS